MGKVMGGPFHPIVGGKRLELLEFPSTVYKVGNISLPFAGGFYLRFWPYPMIKRWLLNVGKKKDAFIYCHPWEIDTEQPRVKARPHIKFVHYHNLHSTYEKIENLLRDFSLYTMGEIVHDGHYPGFELK
jgi:hypothetical protein